MCWLDHPFYLIQTPTLWVQIGFSSPYLQLSCLFYLFLLVPRLLAGITLVDWLIVLHKIVIAIGGGVSVAKGKHPWMVVVGPWTSSPSPNRVIHLLSLKDRDSTLAGAYHYVSFCVSYAPSSRSTEEKLLYDANLLTTYEDEKVLENTAATVVAKPSWLFLLCMVQSFMLLVLIFYIVKRGKNYLWWLTYNHVLINLLRPLWGTGTDLLMFNSWLDCCIIL